MRRYFLSIACFMALYACGDDAGSPEAQIRAYVTAAELSAEARDVGGINDLIADEYSDRNGYDRNAVSNLFRVYFMQHQSLHLLTRIEKLSFPASDVADVTVTVGVGVTVGVAVWAAASPAHSVTRAHVSTTPRHIHLLRRSDQYDDPFKEFSIPQAVLRFRQGMGRLIRNKGDKGAIVVLDRRITGRSYGQSFLRSIPPCTLKPSNLTTVGPLAAQWVGEDRGASH